MAGEGESQKKAARREAMPTLLLLMSAVVVMFFAAYVFPEMKANFTGTPDYDLNGYSKSVFDLKIEVWGTAAAGIFVLSLAEFFLHGRGRRRYLLAPIFAAAVACLAVQSLALLLPAVGFL